MSTHIHAKALTQARGIQEATMVLVTAFAAWAASGCANDPRISLEQFRQMQYERQAAAQAPTTQPAELARLAATLNQRLGPYKVGRGDVLGVMITGPDQIEPPAPVQVRIDRNGKIELPLVGEVNVAGKELEDVEKAIKAAYVPDVYRQAVVHVQLLTPQQTNVLVTGAVTEPGLVQLRRTERNMLFAIDAAGGVSELASGKATLRRIRHPEQMVTYDLTDPAQLQKALEEPPLENGDILYMHPAQPNMVFIGGLVNLPRPQTYPPGVKVTLLQAIAGAGGLRTDVTPREATLIRRMPDGTDVQVKLDLDKISRGEQENITLAAGDIVWVPDTLETRVQDWINRNIFIRAGMSVTYNVTGVEFLNRRSLQAGQAGRNQESLFDPFGFLSRSAALQNILTAPAPAP